MVFAVSIIVLLAVAGIDAQADCTGKPDGACCAGCQSYTNCTGGIGIVVDCPLPDYCYNELIGGCDLMTNTPPPCGKNHNCSSLPDAKYPDMMTEGKECESFFTCSGGINLGVNPCNAPGTTGLVFHFKLQTCDWEWAVPPPCGTYGVSPPPRF